MIESLKPIYNKTLRPAALLLSAAGVHPNHITILGVVLFCIAGYFAYNGNWIITLVLVIVGGTFDGLDGVLARESGKKSVFGAILDSSCDRLTEIVLILGILLYYLYRPSVDSAGVILCFTAVGGSLMVSYVKARCESVSVPCKSGILQRPERIILLCIGLLTGSITMLWVLAVISALGFITSIQRLFEAARYCRKK